MKTLLFAFLLASLPLRSHALTNVWFSPNGTGDGSSREKPKGWDPGFVYWTLLGNRPTTDPDVVINFLPGEYLTEPLDTVTTGPSKIRLTMVGHGERPDEVVLKLKPNYPRGAGPNGYDSVSVINLANNEEYLRRFVAENLTLDGNWDGQTNYNSASYLRGYKNAPLQVSARTGRIRRVILRNFGSHGLMPHTPENNSSGVETFPLMVMTQDEGQEPEDGDPRAWVIEDCEIAGMHTFYGGYSTFIMAQPKINLRGVTPDWAKSDSARRLILVRRCQLRGVPGGFGVLALGTAGRSYGTGDPRNFASGKITFSDNVILNAGYGFNTDTASIQNLDFTDSLFLDAGTVGNLGQPESGPNHTNYNIIGNSIRLFGRQSLPVYEDYGFTNVAGRLVRLNPEAVVLGRLRTNNNTAVQIVGAAKDITIDGNWLTTRPREQFFRPAPGRSDEARFRMVYKMEPNVHFDDISPARQRGEALNVRLTNNLLSGEAFDFGKFEPIEGGSVAFLGEKTKNDALNVRLARPAGTRFQPIGVVERVNLIFTNAVKTYSWQTVVARADGLAVTNRITTNQTERVLFGGEELAIGRPVVARKKDSVTVRVRAALQPLPRAGLSGTQPLSGRTVRLEILPDSLHTQRFSAKTDAFGFASFTYPISSSDNGVDHYRAWTDGTDGSQGRWREHRTAWSTATFEFGTAVSVKAQPDVADARFDRPARLHFKRTGNLAKSLTVKWTATEQPEAAKAGRDFKVSGGKGDSVTFPAGAAEVVLELNPLHDEAHKDRVTTVSVEPGEGYGPGESPSASMVVYNPPGIAPRAKAKTEN